MHGRVDLHLLVLSFAWDGRARPPSIRSHVASSRDATSPNVEKKLSSWCLLPSSFLSGSVRSPRRSGSFGFEREREFLSMGRTKPDRWTRADHTRRVWTTRRCADSTSHVVLVAIMAMAGKTPTHVGRKGAKEACHGKRRDAKQSGGVHVPTHVNEAKKKPNTAKRREALFAWTTAAFTTLQATSDGPRRQAQAIEAETALSLRYVLDQLEQEGIKEATMLIEELQKRGMADRQAILDEESRAKAAIAKARAEGEQEAVRSLAMGKTLCATPYGVDIVGISTSILALGALVGGLSARSRKMELEKVNEKLRAVNQQLRQQTRKGMSPSINTLYAPGLTYAPQQGRNNGNNTMKNNAVSFLSEEEAEEADEEYVKKEDSNGSSTSTSKYSPGASVDLEPAGPVCDLEVPAALRHGKRSLREGKGSEALAYFNKALMLTRQQGDKIQERRASRGVAAAKKLQGDLKGAISYQHKVLQLSQEMQDFTGDSDALGTIADLYTELGDLETAGEYYDKYLTVLGREIE